MEHSVEVNVTKSEDELNDVFQIRREVFVVEQKVDEREEYDDFENVSKHLIARLDGKAVGTARVRKTTRGVKLERFAVLKEARGAHVGAALVQSALDLCEEYSHVYLHAQIQVVDFYAKYGFVKEGDEFMEAGIRHYKMVLARNN
jgi:predicted GNAT family N-acyltransferase